MSSLKTRLISGCSILETLNDVNAQTNLGVVYHGTHMQLDEISPRNCRLWFRGQYILDTDQPVVCASDNPTIAAFRALVPRTGQLFGCSRTRNREGGLTFYVPESHQQQFISAVGYVSLCGKEDFKPYAPDHVSSGEAVSEYRSDQSIIPLCNIEIDYTDFEDLLYSDPRNRLRYT